jgi:hypothetical protein
MVQVGNRMPDTVHAPGADLDWTASPRIEVGYRLPSGFGEFALSYRFLATEGSGAGLGPDGPAALHSRLDVHIVDFDYISREWSLWPHCGMRWRFGLRFASVYYDAQANEPFDEAAAGSGVFAMRNTSDSYGWGPHAGVEVEHKFGWQGLAVVAAVDGSSLFARNRQVYSEATTTLGPDGHPLGAAMRFGNPETIPTFNLQVGVGWEPPSYPYAHFFVGYQYEYWWNVGRLSNFMPRGELSDQGIVLRAEFNF